MRSFALLVISGLILCCSASIENFEEQYSDNNDFSTVQLTTSEEEFETLTSTAIQSSQPVLKNMTLEMCAKKMTYYEEMSKQLREKNLEFKTKQSELKIKITQLEDEKSKIQAAENKTVAGRILQVLTALTKKTSLDIQLKKKELSRLPMTLIGGKFYHYAKINKPWHEADSYCRSRDLQLVSFETDQELAAISNWIINDYGLPKQRQVWTSANELSGSYIWTATGSPVNMNKNWLPGQPDRNKGKEHCMTAKYQYNNILQYNDVTCETTISFICELN